jgi:hypothetical protein
VQFSAFLTFLKSRVDGKFQSLVDPAPALQFCYGGNSQSSSLGFAFSTCSNCRGCKLSARSCAAENDLWPLLRLLGLQVLQPIQCMDSRFRGIVLLSSTYTCKTFPHQGAARPLDAVGNLRDHFRNEYL